MRGISREPTRVISNARHLTIMCIRARDGTRDTRFDSLFVRTRDYLDDSSGLASRKIEKSSPDLMRMTSLREAITMSRDWTLRFAASIIDKYMPRDAFYGHIHSFSASLHIVNYYTRSTERSRRTESRPAYMYDRFDTEKSTEDRSRRRSVERTRKNENRKGKGDGTG